MRTQNILILTASGLALLAGLGFYIDAIARPVLASGLALVIWSLSRGSALGVLIVLIAWAGIGWERYQTAKENRLEAKARRLRAERDAGVMIATAGAGEQVYLIESGPLRGETIAKPLHLNPAQYINGRQPIISETEETRWGMYQRIHATAKALGPGPVLIEPPLALPAPGQPGGIIEALAREQRLLLLGPSGSGKSSVLRHVVSEKLKQAGRIILCDPHGSRPKWGSEIDAVGFGERFEDILETFTRLEWTHKSRIRQIEAGHPERAFEIITVVLEEVQALVEYFNEADRGRKRKERVNIGHYIKMFLTRTRKTGIDVIAASQASTVDALGLRGFAQNRDAFALAEIMGRDGRGHRVRLIDERGDTQESDAPPLWPDYLPVGVTPQRVLLLPPAPTPEQYRIIEALRAEPGAKDYRICQMVWGAESDKPVKGSSYVNKINEVRQLFGPF